MRTLVAIVTGLIIGYTVHQAAFGTIPDNMGPVLLGYALSVLGITLVALAEDR